MVVGGGWGWAAYEAGGVMFHLWKRVRGEDEVVPCLPDRPLSLGDQYALPPSPPTPCPKHTQIPHTPTYPVHLRRELGCVGQSVKVTGADGASLRAYRVSLLSPGGTEGKTLGDSFPGLRLGARKPPGGK